MRIVLIEIQSLGHHFLAEPPPSAITTAESAPRGVRGWLARKWYAFLDDLEQSRGFVGKTLGGIWTRMQRLIAPDEYLLRCLRSADQLWLDHPACLSEECVLERWDGYLRLRVAKHRKWLLIDIVLAFPAFLLGPLPGPNIVFYWLCYRAVVHFFVRRGASRARKRALPTCFQPRPELDAALVLGDDERIASLAETLCFADLAVVLARVAPGEFGFGPGAQP